MQRILGCPYFQKAVGWCVPIGGLGGLIGLGGGEFRLPVLLYAIGFGIKDAIPLNLMISLVTLLFAMIMRSHALSLADIVPYWGEILGLTAGGMISAFHGARLIRHLTTARLIKTIAGLLAALGVLLLLEALFPFRQLDFLPPSVPVHILIGVLLGLGIGLVSSMLGVAGGELLIPTLIFVFGVDIRTAGSASILISLSMIVVGLWRYWQLDALPRGRSIQRITLAMSLGSIIGATIGGLAVAVAPIIFLKILLGCILIAAAGKTMLSHR